MKYVIILSVLIYIPTVLSANDFKKREEIINSILSNKTTIQSNKNNNKQKRPINNKKQIGTTSISTEDFVLLKTGIEFFNSNLLDASLMKFRELTKKHPKSRFLDSAKVYISKIHIKKYKYLDAIKTLSTSRNKSGEYRSALLYSAHSYRLRGDYIKAVAFYQKFYSLYPQDSRADDALLIAGRMHLQNRKGSLALDSITRLIKQYKNRETIDEAYHTLGKIFEINNTYRNIETARKIYKIFLAKAKKGEKYFKDSPLLTKVLKDLNKIEKKYFKYE